MPEMPKKLKEASLPAAKKKSKGGKEGSGDGVVFPSAGVTAPPKCADPATQFGAACACFEVEFPMNMNKTRIEYETE